MKNKGDDSCDIGAMVSREALEMYGDAAGTQQSTSCLPHGASIPRRITVVHMVTSEDPCAELLA